MNIDYDAYQTFADKVVNTYRYVLDKESVAFQDILKDTIEKRELTITSEQRLFRARKGHNKSGENWIQPYPVADMLAPPPEKANEGRVNPKGIPCFYAAEGMKTAVMEMRPWIGELISVAIFKPYKNLKLVDLTADGQVSIKLKKCLGKALPCTKEEIERQIWSELNDAFSEPISIDDQTAKYAPTQIISEWFKSWDYDGVVYKSSIHEEGKNYAFFNANLFTAGNEAGKSQVRQVTEIETKEVSANTILSASECRN